MGLLFLSRRGVENACEIGETEFLHIVVQDAPDQEVVNG